MHGVERVLSGMHRRLLSGDGGWLIKGACEGGCEIANARGVHGRASWAPSSILGDDLREEIEYGPLYSNWTEEKAQLRQLRNSTEKGAFKTKHCNLIQAICKWNSVFSFAFWVYAQCRSVFIFPSHVDTSLDSVLCLRPSLVWKTITIKFFKKLHVSKE